MGFDKITSITASDGERVNDKEAIAKELLQSFFTIPPVAQKPSQNEHRRRPQFKCAPITKDEIELPLFSASSDRAPGRDGQTIRV